jgi:hypothetical protein
VISVLDAPSPYDDPTSAAEGQRHDGYVRVSLDGTLNLHRVLADAIAQIEEHADSQGGS